MPRIARLVAPNYPHHVTQRGTNRNEIFLDDDDREYFLQSLKEYAVRTDTNIWAYCLMRNHFHLLLVPESEESLGKCLHGTTFRYAQYFNQKYERSGRLWQNRYFSCVVDKREYLWLVARHIERNPVRAKVAKNPEDWEWSSARVHINGEKDMMLSLNDWLNETEVEEYRKFVNEDGKEEEVRRATCTGRPLGDLKFTESLERKLGRPLKPGKAGRPKKFE